MLHKVFTLTLSLVTVVLVATSLGQAQYTVGDPVAANSSGSLASVSSYFDAYTGTSSYATSNDMCLRIQYVYNTLLPSGSDTTVDARGFTTNNAPTGGWVCSVNPFSVSGSSTALIGKGRLLLGYVSIPAQVTWVVPTHMILQGIGTDGSGANGAAVANTVIYASGSSFSAWGSQGSQPALAVLQMGLGGTSSGHQSASYGVQIRDLTVDCNNVTNCVGIVNNNSEEGSLVNNVQIFNAPAYGLWVTTNNSYSTGYGAVNSGPYQDVFVNYTTCSNCGANSIALRVDGATTTGTGGEGRSIRGFDNLTLSGNNVSSTPNTLLEIYGVSTSITNSHLEFCSGTSSCIVIGNPSAALTTTGVRISDVTVSNNNGGYDVSIAGNTTYPTGNVLIENLNHESINTHTITDSMTGYTVGDNYLGWYFLGTGTSPAILTSSNNLSSGAYALRVGAADITGTLTKPGGSFRIDHPLDPANEYLYHSFVESPDMMNIYNGTVTTDKKGMATVILPAYFEALNQDFRYQLTPVGQFAQAYVSEKVMGNRFVIKTNKPGVEVSWQVTGIRHDTYANEHRIKVEEAKPLSLRQH
jgi:hypothetical protein